MKIVTGILLTVLTLLISTPTLADELEKPEKSCKEVTDEGFICPGSLENPIWKEVCSGGCYLVHPTQRKLDWVNEERVKEIPQLRLDLEKLKLQREEAKAQRDGALEDVVQFEKLWKDQVKITDHWKQQAEDAFGFWEMAGAAGGGFLLGSILTTGIVLLFMFGV